MLTTLRRIPPPLLLAYGLALVVELALVVHTLQPTDDGLPLQTGPTWRMILEASRVATTGLALGGSFAMARRLTGRRAAGALLATIGYALDLAMHLAWIAFEIYIKRRHYDFPESTWKIIATADTCVAVVFATGLALAARRAWLVAIAVPVTLLTNPLWFFDALFQWMHLGPRGLDVLQSGLGILFVLAMLSLIFFAGADLPEASEPACAPAGLRQVAVALRMRVIAKVAIAFFGLVLAGAAVRGDLAVYRYVTFAGMAVHVAVLCVLAWGLLEVARSGAPDTPVWPFVCAGGLALAVVGLTLDQVPVLVDIFYPIDDMFSGQDALQQFLAIGSIAGELVASAAIVVALAGVNAFARRRGLEALRTLASQRAGLFVTIAVCSIATQYWATHADEMTPTTAIVSLVAAVAILIATWLAAAVCKSAADALDSAPGLPAAKLMR
jgi:hypothetical protein